MKFPCPEFSSKEICCFVEKDVKGKHFIAFDTII